LEVLDCATCTTTNNWYVRPARDPFRKWQEKSRHRAHFEGWQEVSPKAPSSKFHPGFGYRSRRVPTRPPVAGYRRARKVVYLPAKIDLRFSMLAREWKAESRFASSPNQMFLLPSYQKIIALGPPAIPLILRDLNREPNHWFWALAALTGENPARAEQAGNVGAMRDAWIAWGRRQGYL